MEYNLFTKFSAEYNIVPVYKIISADLLTPVAAYLKIREDNSTSFLLESVEGIGRLARYSFIGLNPSEIISNYGNELILKSKNGTEKSNRNLFDFLKEQVNSFSHPVIEQLPYFTGGIVGYIGFENISLIEDVIEFTGEKNEKRQIPGAYEIVENGIQFFKDGKLVKEFQVQFQGNDTIRLTELKTKNSMTLARLPD